MSAARTGTKDTGGEDLLSVPAEKVQAWHRERVAVVYVRQSTLQQVRLHQESTRRQYNLTSRVRALGWSSTRIVVIDEDQRKSAASSEGRAGFQRLVSEVSSPVVGGRCGPHGRLTKRGNPELRWIISEWAVRLLAFLRTHGPGPARGYAGGIRTKYAWPWRDDCWRGAMSARAEEKSSHWNAV